MSLDDTAAGSCHPLAGSSYGRLRLWEHSHERPRRQPVALDGAATGGCLPLGNTSSGGCKLLAGSPCECLCPWMAALQLVGLAACLYPWMGALQRVHLASLLSGCHGLSPTVDRREAQGPQLALLLQGLRARMRACVHVCAWCVSVCVCVCARARTPACAAASRTAGAHTFV